MPYFKKVQIENYTRSEAEAALRKVSLKRTSPLDFSSAITDIGSDKLFLGYIGKSALTFTRLRTSVEKFLPKLVIKLPLDGEDCYYQLRLSVVSATVFILFTFGFLIAFAGILSGNTEIGGLLSAAIFLGLYFALLAFEINIVSNRIKKALLKSQSAIHVRPF